MVSARREKSELKETGSGLKNNDQEYEFQVRLQKMRNAFLRDQRQLPMVEIKPQPCQTATQLIVLL